MKQHVLQLQQITKGFGSAAVLGPISLSVDSGEVLGIRGSNGAGKSTLLKVIAGIYAPDSGTVLRPDAGAIGYVPQDIALYPELSGADNLRFWGDVYRLPRRAAAARSAWLLEQLMLSDYAKKRMSTYSGGMKRRLNLAAALMATPSLLLLDEPTAGADEASAGIMLQLVRRLCDRGAAAVLVTHHPEELRALCRRVVTLEHGVVAGEELLP